MARTRYLGLTRWVMQVRTSFQSCKLKWTNTLLLVLFITQLTKNRRVKMRNSSNQLRTADCVRTIGPPQYSVDTEGRHRRQMNLSLPGSLQTCGFEEPPTTCRSSVTTCQCHSAQTTKLRCWKDKGAELCVLQTTKAPQQQSSIRCKHWRAISTVDNRTVLDCWSSSVQCIDWKQASSTNEFHYSFQIQSTTVIT